MRWRTGGLWRWAVGGLLLVGGACHRPLAQRFVVSSDAPSRTGLTPLGPSAVVLGNGAGALLCLGSAGEVRWRRELGHEVTLAPVVAEGDVVVAATAAGDVYGLLGDSGQERWRRPGQEVPVGLASDGGRVLLLTAPGTLTALAAGTGERLWQRALPPLRAGRAAAGAQDARGGPGALRLLPEEGLVLAARADAVDALHLEDGRPAWHRPLPELLGLGVGGSGELWASTRGGVLWALAPKTGAVLRRKELPGPISSPPCPALGRLWLGLSDGVLLELQPASLELVTGRPLPSPMTACPAEFRGLLAVPTRGAEGELLLFRDGVSAPVTTARVDSGLWASPLALGGLLWVPSHDGRVTALAFAKPGPATSR